jgi:hypothetical protein
VLIAWALHRLAVVAEAPAPAPESATERSSPASRVGPRLPA